MAIRTQSRFIGEGISDYGETNAQEALCKHRLHVRRERLADLLGNDTKLSCVDIARRFYEISIAISAADSQVQADNADFIEEHSLKLKDV